MRPVLRSRAADLYRLTEAHPSGLDIMTLQTAIARAERDNLFDAVTRFDAYIAQSATSIAMMHFAFEERGYEGDRMGIFKPEDLAIIREALKILNETFGG